MLFGTAIPTCLHAFLSFDIGLEYERFDIEETAYRVFWQWWIDVYVENHYYYNWGEDE